MKSKRTDKPYLWVPGEGCDHAALVRMSCNIDKPRTPMGEAWFMGETRGMFTGLMGDLIDAPLDEVQNALFEISSGTRNFGPRDEWSDWFHYILSETVICAHHAVAFHSHVEPLVTAFITQYPNGISRELYRGFRADALATLGRCMMDGECWKDGRIIPGRFLHRQYNPGACVWGWADASGDFAASLFFCLKYLSAQEIDPWLRSVLSIASPHWRAQIMVWFIGAHELLTGAVADPSGFEIRDRPSLHWQDAHLLRYPWKDEEGPAFLPQENREAALATITSVMSDELYLDWMCSIAEIDYLESELAELPDRFYALYVCR